MHAYKHALNAQRITCTKFTVRGMFLSVALNTCKPSIGALINSIVLSYNFTRN